MGPGAIGRSLRKQARLAPIEPIGHATRMQRRTFLKLTGGGLAWGLAGALLPVGSASASRVFPADGEIDFTALRNGQTIGRHRIRFVHDGPRFIVRTDIAVEITFLGATLYRFTHHAEETWLDGWFHAVVSDTDDDGRLSRVRAERRDGIFGGTANGTDFTVSGYIIPATLWHRDTTASQALFDVIDARLKIVRPQRLGSEEVPVAGQAVMAEHYQLQGEFQRDLWYDSDCGLVRVAFLGRDGSQITLEPR